MPLPHSQLWKNLILDDYFVVRAALPHQPKEETSVFHHLVWARQAYQALSLPGSVVRRM
jgi:hypothetical protein